MVIVRKHVMNTCPKSAILVVHFTVGGIAVLMAKLGTRWSVSVYRGECAYRMCSKAFKTRLGSSFTVRISSFICKILKYKAGFILKFKVVCVATCTLMMNCYSHDYHNCSHKLTVV